MIAHRVDRFTQGGEQIMKKGLLALGLLIACMGAGSAQPQQDPQTSAEKLFGSPENRVHDFGAVPRGSQLYHEFVLTNIYAVPVEITSIQVG
jgi:hypothetical protein